MLPAAPLVVPTARASWLDAQTPLGAPCVGIAVDGLGLGLGLGLALVVAGWEVGVPVLLITGVVDDVGVSDDGGFTLLVPAPTGAEGPALPHAATSNETAAPINTSCRSLTTISLTLV